MLPTEEAKGDLLLGRRLLLLLDHRNDLNLAASLLELLFSRCREEMRVHGQFLRKIAISQDLDQGRLARNQAPLLERGDIHHAFVEQLADVAEVHREHILGEAPIGEPALRNAAGHRRLAAFEARLRNAVVTGARLLALLALAGGLVQTRAVAAAEALLVANGPFVRPKRVQRRSHFTLRPRPSRGARPSGSSRGSRACR